MTTEQEVHDWDGCLMCAVRALTEGRAPEWALNNDRKPGDTVTGVVLRQGETPDALSRAGSLTSISGSAVRTGCGSAAGG